MAKLAREQHLDAVSLLDWSAGTAESQWDRYLATLDRAAGVAAARVLAAAQIREKGSRIGRIKASVQAQMAAHDEERRVTRRCAVHVLQRTPAELSVWELPPGKAGNPYHHLLVQTRLVLVLEGRLTLRTGETRRELHAGDAVALSSEKDGDHELISGTQERVRFLALSACGHNSLLI
jgi:uncharacterized cupin superfamily protein